jgi:hypothetical protein
MHENLIFETIHKNVIISHLFNIEFVDKFTEKGHFVIEINYYFEEFSCQ